VAYGRQITQYPVGINASLLRDVLKHGIKGD